MDVLKAGRSGPPVTELQEQLRARGFNPGRLDGVFGPGTEAAVIAFQRAEGLLADGIVGARTRKALGLLPDLAIEDVTGAVTAGAVSRMFPHTPLRNINENLPHVLQALCGAGLTDRRMVLMALATIRAESESFAPVDERMSRFNTSPSGHPFDLYDHRRDLGNRGVPDGARFKGRGFVQLTGRANYATYSDRLDLGRQLLESPARANEPVLAARLLALFLADRERAIKEALIAGDLRQARRLVNGGSHGLERFADAYRRGEAILADGRA